MANPINLIEAKSKIDQCLRAGLERDDITLIVNRWTGLNGDMPAVHEYLDKMAPMLLKLEPTEPGPKEPEIPSSFLSKEIPELMSSHLAHLMKSAISMEVIKERGYRSIIGYAAVGHDLKGDIPGQQVLRDLGFASNQAKQTPGILIPIYGVEGKIVTYQYRPDSPRTDAKDRPIKYENPKGGSVRLDVPPRSLAKLGDPTVPLWITEGCKKVDALVSAGACAIGLTGVWGFKGRNKDGGSTLLADWQYIDLHERIVHIVFDSDIVEKEAVKKALETLTAVLTAKGAQVKNILLPPGPENVKVGVDDFLAQGHNLEDVVKLDVKGTAGEIRPAFEKYGIRDGVICWVRHTDRLGDIPVPLCNFAARVIENVLTDNGQEVTVSYKIDGRRTTGEVLPPVEVQEKDFDSMNWARRAWGIRTKICAGQSIKDRLREAITDMSYYAKDRTVYSHTGWRKVDGKMVFLTAGGAIGAENIGVAMDKVLQPYRLPKPEGDPLPAMRASLDFLEVADIDITLPIWVAMYLAPLSEIIDTPFTIWYVGASGCFKSTLTGLALCHFGNFDAHHLPAAWRDTANQLEKLLFLTKDLPLVIDDWAPGADAQKARELEVKAEHVIRAQGNRQGKGRMMADTSSRIQYTPRGLLITSGEQLPGGQSHTARIFTVPIERGLVRLPELTTAQKQQGLYPIAMSHYIAWIRDHWDQLKKELPEAWEANRQQAHLEQHPRLAEEVALLYTGLSTALSFMASRGAMTEETASGLLGRGWRLFMRLATEQGNRVEIERPAERFMDALRTIYSMGTLQILSSISTESATPNPGQTFAGWHDSGDKVFYFLPGAIYRAVVEHCGRSGEPLNIKKAAVWADLRRQGYLVLPADSDDYRVSKWVGGTSHDVVVIPERLVSGDNNDELL